MKAPADRDREDLAALLLRLRSKNIRDPRLLKAVEAVPRRRFLPDGIANSYSERSVPLDCGETMPGADMSVRLVHALQPEESDRVLEIGTGSGYVTALLAQLAGRVVSLDRYRTLVEAARRRLEALEIDRVALFQEDGRDGFPEKGPYERILVHASFEAPPRQFLDQLSQQGFLVCAIGPGDGLQTLAQLQKVGSRFEREDFGTARLQPLKPGVAAAL